MKKIKLSDPARATAESVLGEINHYEIISQTNNLVYLAVTDRGLFVIKEVLDPTVDAILEQEFLEKLQPHPLFRPVIAVERLGNGSVVSIAPYIEGQSFDTVCRKGQYSPETALLWVEDLHEIFRQVQSIPVKGFGRPRSGGGQLYARWTDFLDWYLKRQKKKGPLLASMRFKHLWNTFVSFRSFLDAQNPEPHLICADVNARNFLVSSNDNRLRLIHIPIFWYADPAVPYGEMLIHLHDTHMAESIIKSCGFPAWRLHFYAAFAAYVILAYVERFDPTPLEQALPWGGKRPLLDLLDEHLAELDRGQTS